MSYDTIRDRNHRPERLHKCAISGCEEMISRRLLMCPAHWRMVPQPQQRAVYNTWRNGGAAAYLAAREAAIRSVHSQL